MARIVKRCVICRCDIEKLHKCGVGGATLVYAGSGLKQMIRAILEQFKDVIPNVVAVRLRAAVKLETDAICEGCAGTLWNLFRRARLAKQTAPPLSEADKATLSGRTPRLDVKDSAPVDHLDRLREGEPELTEGEAKTFRELMKSLRSGDGPVADEV